MYKVLLVDDEVNILEGIAAIVDWEGCGTVLESKARHGQMAYELIKKQQPDIVITDIKMPGMNGVELIQKVHREYPAIRFIVLSGHDEFEFAKTAMESSVKHYLLKPSDEEKIEKALKQIVEELDEEETKEQFLTDMHHHLQQVMPKAKEQFLKDFITNKKYGVQHWEYYSQVFKFDTNAEEFRLLVGRIDDDYEYEHLMALKKIIVEAVGEERIPLETTVGDKFVILVEMVSLEDVISRLEKAKESFSSFYPMDYTVAVSDNGSISQLRQLYNETLNGLTQRFYVAEGSIITMQDMKKDKTRVEELQYDHEDLIYAVRSGNTNMVLRYLNDFFEEVWQEKYEVSLVQSHCLELFMSIIRQASKEDMDDYLKKIGIFLEYEKLHELKQFIEETASEISNYHYERTKQTQSNIINRVIEYVEKHLSDQELSLSHIAADVLYMNSDYLGKLFKKEIGERFSSYLVRRRIEKAIEMIERSDEIKIFEIAKEVGFGNNPRYFGQVFKKQTGVTPTAYLNNK